MSRFTDEERADIRAMFRRLADVQADQVIARLEANPNALVQIDVPAVAMVEADIRQLAGLNKSDLRLEQ